MRQKGNMKNKKRARIECINCGKTESIMPRNDGKPQRPYCYKCLPRPVFVPAKKGGA
jgi:hypothetical protein